MNNHYSYHAITKQGIRVTGHMYAENQQQLAEQLSIKGYYLIQSHCQQMHFWHHYLYFIDLQQIQELCFQLYLLLQAGIPLMEALTTISDQLSSKSMKIMVQSLTSQINQGSLLSQALDSFPKLFDNTFVSVIRTSEHTGQLAACFQKLSQYMIWKMGLRQQVIRALIYPLLLSSVMIGLISALVIFVIPELEPLISNDQPQSLMTQSLIITTQWIQDYGVIAIVITLLIMIFCIIMRALSRTFSYEMSLVFLKLPLLGKLIELINAEKFTNTMMVLLTANIPLLISLEQSRLSLSNKGLQQRIIKVIHHIQQGALLSQAIRQEGLFRGLLPHIIATGERSGELAQAMSYAHDYYQQALKARLDMLIRLMEPLLIMIMGLILIWIAMAIFVPLYDQIGQIVP